MTYFPIVLCIAVGIGLSLWIGVLRFKRQEVPRHLAVARLVAAAATAIALLPVARQMGWL